MVLFYTGNDTNCPNHSNLRLLNSPKRKLFRWRNRVNNESRTRIQRIFPFTEYSRILHSRIVNGELRIYTHTLALP